MATHNSNNSRSRAIRKAFSSMSKTVSNIITYPYRRFTRKQTLVHPSDSSPRSSPKNKTSKVTPSPKHKKRQPNYPPPSTPLSRVNEENETSEVDSEDIKLDNLGNGIKRKTNKKRNSRKK